MGQKDLTAKELENRADVFADIINALVYEGEQIVSSEMLCAAPTETLYADITGKGNDKGLKTEAEEEQYGRLHNQYHDVSKYETMDYENRTEGRLAVHSCRRNGKKEDIKRGSKISGLPDDVAGRTIKIQYILENESNENYRLLLRKAGYEGAVYRNEYEEGQIYPVVILVLYWGDKEWKPHLDMRELFADKLENPMIKKYVDNIKLHLYPMAHLPEEIRQRFRSDMRIVVDYLAEGKSYKPTGQIIRHIGPVMRLLYALTGEKELEEILLGMQDRQAEGEGVVMGEYYTTYFARKCRQEGREEGRQEGREEGRQEGREEGRQEGREEGRQEGREEGRQEGREEGEQVGIKKGMDRLNSLISALIEKGREEDMKRSLKDRKYQKELFKEFGL